MRQARLFLRAGRAADALALRAGSGIGAANPLETQVNTVAAETEQGGIQLSNTGALTIGTVNGLSGVSIVDAGAADAGAAAAADAAGRPAVPSQRRSAAESPQAAGPWARRAQRGGSERRRVSASASDERARSPRKAGQN